LGLPSIHVSLVHLSYAKFDHLDYILQKIEILLTRPHNFLLSVYHVRAIVTLNGPMIG